MNLYDNLIYSALNGSGGGGGGGSYKVGSLRSDAELVQEWTDDILAVTDLGYTIPSYSTSTKTVKAAESLGTITPESGYCYLICYQTLSAPVYNNNNGIAGRGEWCIRVGNWEIISPAKSICKSASGTEVSTIPQVMTNSDVRTLTLYWSDATTLVTATGLSGATQTVPSLILNNNEVSINGPTLQLLGNSTRMSSDAWSHMTDLRYYYNVQVYRLPNGSGDVIGWGFNSEIANLARVFNSWAEAR